ncbi:MAG: sulfotransferase family protein [Flavobacteriales bacterium]|nr:sulfotransferase family protein [Flavobacteriales bacterium]
MNKKICLWSCPRNVSTALMYSFRSRLDTIVFDEPLYAHYLKVTNSNHPAREEVLDTQEKNGEKVVKDIILKDYPKHSFFKLMTHFLVDIDKSFLYSVINVIFIRNPKEIIHSYSKIIAGPKMKDIGVKMQYELYHELKEKGKELIVLDSKYLLQNPNGILSELCDKIGIPFDKNMLEWTKGPKKEDGVWANYWYQNTHNSTTFSTYKEKKILLNREEETLYKECLPFYNFLTEKSIKI